MYFSRHNNTKHPEAGLVISPPLECPKKLKKSMTKWQWHHHSKYQQEILKAADAARERRRPRKLQKKKRPERHSIGRLVYDSDDTEAEVDHRRIGISSPFEAKFREKSSHNVGHSGLLSPRYRFGDVLVKVAELKRSVRKRHRKAKSQRNGVDLADAERQKSEKEAIEEGYVMLNNDSEVKIKSERNPRIGWVTRLTRPWNVPKRREDEDATSKIINKPIAEGRRTSSNLQYKKPEFMTYSYYRARRLKVELAGDDDNTLKEYKARDNRNLRTNGVGPSGGGRRKLGMFFGVAI
ncbi:hypothetical protein BDN70DRAFT_896309 [Pholiota conissans]|uniref:Uncharacterized protein n=1 Tax=Pholiota conissans TaxID=109636 RepID=A0A9P6CS17_9AGAR|nr:hypothetical protein BDN70DRAFT_896309 [Pholiota conissans]